MTKDEKKLRELREKAEKMGVFDEAKKYTRVFTKDGQTKSFG